MTWKPWFALPVRWLVPLLLALLALTSMMLIYLFEVREYREDVELQERRRLLERMALEQTRLEVQLGQDNPLQVRRLVSSLGLYSGITHAWLVDGQGRVRAALSRLQVGRSLSGILAEESPALRQAIQQALSDPEAVIHVRAIPEEEALLGHVAIVDGHHLFLRVDLARPLAERLYAGRGEIWREAGMTLFFAAFLGVLLHVPWFRRTTQLSAAIAALGAGRMETRVGLAGRDEFAVIGAAIDRMAAELQQRQAQLRRLASLIERSSIQPPPATYYGVNRRVNGQLVDVQVDWTYIRNADGSLQGFVSVITDITERKRLETEIRRINADLEERVRQRTAELAAANKELETFSYSVSHDLKAPLRGIDGYSQLLLTDYGDRLDEEGRLFLNNVRQGVARMNQLIEDLLAYSRMERRSLDPVSLNLEREIGKILAEREAEIASRGMRVEMAVQGLAARADPNGLALVLRNLIDNALKFTRDIQTPLLRIFGKSSDQSTIILGIQDNGIGFDMRFHDRLFEIFQRLQRAEDYPGTGVGLAIVRKAARRMGGRVWAESAPGQGATFYLELPR